MSDQQPWQKNRFKWSHKNNWFSYSLRGNTRKAAVKRLSKNAHMPMYKYIIKAALQCTYVKLYEYFQMLPLVVKVKILLKKTISLK